MSDTLEGIRSQVLTSIYGRRLGLDKDGCLVGAPAFRVPVTAVTTAYTANIPSYGVVTVQTATAATPYTLDPPKPGAVVDIISISTSGAVITLESGNFMSNASSTLSAMTLTAASSYQGVRLVGLSTALMRIDNLQSSSITTGITFA